MQHLQKNDFFVVNKSVSSNQNIGASVNEMHQNDYQFFDVFLQNRELISSIFCLLKDMIWWDNNYFTNLIDILTVLTSSIPSSSIPSYAFIIVIARGKSFNIREFEQFFRIWSIYHLLSTNWKMHFRFTILIPKLYQNDVTIGDPYE